MSNSKNKFNNGQISLLGKDGTTRDLPIYINFPQELTFGEIEEFLQGGSYSIEPAIKHEKEDLRSLLNGM